ncbi:hypothetical protein SAMN05444161_7091 [Rhizobiales bacterium GAS191]|nr:hypothetical protein SAMN05444161_7091 [Rhizobiales bacterium GAS191]
MPTIDPALNAELVQLYRELATATMDAASPPKLAPGNAVEEEVLERWRAARNNVERINRRIKEITGEQ